MLHLLNEALNRNKYLDNWYGIPERDWEEALRCFGIEIS